MNSSNFVRPLPRIAKRVQHVSMTKIAFSLNPAIDEAAAVAAYGAEGRVRLPALLAPRQAEAFHAQLSARADWQMVLNSDDKVVELSREARLAMTDAQRAALDTAVYASARAGFQYRFETLRVPDGAQDRQGSADPLFAFAQWLSEGPARDLLRRITGVAAIAFADAQGTAYAPGDFLTGHDDHIEGKSRHAAYVFGLNPTWRAEWGGALLFHGPDGSLSGHTPGFNTLDIFRVGQMHSVSEVTRSAAYRRYSITGWLRGR